MVESKKQMLNKCLIPLECLLQGVIHDEMYEVEQTIQV